MKPIPLSRPFLSGKELDYIQQVFASGHLGGNGHFTAKCEEYLKQWTQTCCAYLTTSCTHALEITAFLMNLQPGDELIVPSFTYVSTVNAFFSHGARPVFIDIRPDTLNMDETKLEALITEKTKAILPVHYMGVACEMDEILRIAHKHNLYVIEDNAHGLFATYKGKPLGSFGHASVTSFHETKNFSCGEGGALFIQHEDWCERAEIIREKGTNRSQFLRGEVDRYTWVDVGSSYIPSEILAAVLFAQLENYETIQKRRGVLWERYNEGLANWGKSVGAQLPFIPSNCTSSYHQFYVLMPDHASRQGLIHHLKEHGIRSAFHYLPLHLSSVGHELGGYPSSCPITEAICNRLIRFPFYPDLEDKDVHYIIDMITQFTC